MKISRKKYKKACKSIRRTRKQMRIVNAWDEAVNKIGVLGNQRLVALTLSKDGSVWAECKFRSEKFSS